MIWPRNHHIYITPMKSPWWELSNGILVDVWVWNLTSNQLVSHQDPAIASSISFCCVHHKISQHHQPTLPGAETIPSISSWFEVSAGMVSAPGVVGWWRCVWRHNTMSNWHQEGWIDGGYFHLLQAPFGAAVAKKHCPCAPSWCSVAAGAVQAPYWLLPL
jgi:hypothetical protein